MWRNEKDRPFVPPGSLSDHYDILAQNNRQIELAFFNRILRYELNLSALSITIFIPWFIHPASRNNLLLSQSTLQAVHKHDWWQLYCSIHYCQILNNSPLYMRSDCLDTSGRVSWSTKNASWFLWVFLFSQHPGRFWQNISPSRPCSTQTDNPSRLPFSFP